MVLSLEESEVRKRAYAAAVPPKSLHYAANATVANIPPFLRKTRWDLFMDHLFDNYNINSVPDGKRIEIDNQGTC